MNQRSNPSSVALVALFALLAFALEGCYDRQETGNHPRMTETKSNSQRDENARDADESPRSIHMRAVAIDMHADTVQFILDEDADITLGAPNLHLDAPRMREGGLDAQFFSIWVEPQKYGAGGERAVRRADEQIAAIRSLAERRPDTWVFAVSAEDVRRAAREGKLAALLGLEGGYAIDGRLENVRKYYDAGVRYMSPTWTVSLPWAGSSGDAAGRGRGLSDFGREVVREMNSLGMMVDVSHVSDETFWDIIDASSKPVIATHSNARAIANVPRNLSDEMIRAIAKTGGVVSVVFYPAFVEPGWEEEKLKVDAEIAAEVSAAGAASKGKGSHQRIARDRVRIREYERRLPPVTVARVADHIERIVRLVGVDHVGVGSDFDGVQALPRDMRTVADLPNLTSELLERGFTEEDVRKILGGNILRVMEATERR